MSDSHSMIAWRLNGARGSRMTGGRRAWTRRFSQLSTSSRRMTGETSTWARAAKSRCDSGERPSASWRSREDARNRAARQIHLRRCRAVSCSGLSGSVRSNVAGSRPVPSSTRIDRRAWRRCRRSTLGFSLVSSCAMDRKNSAGVTKPSWGKHRCGESGMIDTVRDKAAKSVSRRETTGFRDNGKAAPRRQATLP